MKAVEQQKAAKQFAKDWLGRGDEKQDTQAFWLSLLQKVYGVEAPERYIYFELPVKLSHTSFIDGYIAATSVLIEQKSLGIPLDKPQARHGGKTPYEQAKEYDNYLNGVLPSLPPDRHRQRAPEAGDARLHGSRRDRRQDL